MVDLSKFMLPVRGVQLLFAIIVMGMAAALIQDFHNVNFDGYHYSLSVSQFNFNLFTSLWTLLFTTYLLIASWRFADSEKLYHPYLVFALEVLSWVFWLSAWACMAAVLSAYEVYCDELTGCGTVKACVAFGVMEWILFCITAAVAGMQAWSFLRGTRSRKTAGGGMDVGAAPNV